MRVRDKMVKDFLKKYNYVGSFQEFLKEAKSGMKFEVNYKK